MKVAFYKGDGHFFNKVCRWWDSGPYSHMEVVLDCGSCLSSSYRDGGVRAKAIEFDAGKWDFIDFGQLFSELDIVELFHSRLGRDYDTLGMLRFALGTKENSNKDFCSELCMYILGYSEPWRFTPNTAFSTLKQLLASQGKIYIDAKNGNTTYKIKNKARGFDARLVG